MMSRNHCGQPDTGDHPPGYRAQQEAGGYETAALSGLPGKVTHGSSPHWYGRTIPCDPTRGQNLGVSRAAGPDFEDLSRTSTFRAAASSLYQRPATVAGRSASMAGGFLIGHALGSIRGHCRPSVCPKRLPARGNHTSQASADGSVIAAITHFRWQSRTTRRRRAPRTIALLDLIRRRRVEDLAPPPRGRPRPRDGPGRRSRRGRGAM